MKAFLHKFAFCLAAVLVCALLLCACGGSNGQSEPSFPERHEADRKESGGQSEPSFPERHEDDQKESNGQSEPSFPERHEDDQKETAVAVTVGDRSYSPAEVNYLYANQFTDFANNYYAALYGLDTSNGPSGLGSVAYTAPAIEGETFETWRDYFLYRVYTQLEQTQFLLRYAREQGITLDEEELAEVDSDLSVYRDYAMLYGFSVDDFVALNYEGMNYDMLRTLEEETALASKAYTACHDSFRFTEEQLKEEFASYNGDYDSFSFAYYRVAAAAAEDGTVTDEARAEAEAEANAILASYQDDSEVEDLCERFNGYIEEVLGETAICRDGVTGAYLSSVYSDWLKAEARQAGDATVIVNGDNAYAVLFLGRESADYPTVDVRHILIKAAADEDGTWSEAALEEAQAEAQRILAEFEAGDRTEESFAALAEQYSEDIGSSTNGGLYENIYKGQMVEEFNDFCFAEGRKSGDTGIVYGSNGSYAGWHVMYFVSEDRNYSDILAEESLIDRAIDEWLNSSDIVAVPGPDEAAVDPVTAPVRTAEPTEG